MINPTTVIKNAEDMENYYKVELVRLYNMRIDNQRLTINHIHQLKKETTNEDEKAI